jgi:methyl-accepting chemotaxis protein
MKVSNVRFLPKILACFGLLGISVAGALWFATERMKAIDTEYSSILTSNVGAVRASLIVNIRIQNLIGDVWRIIALSDHDEIDKTDQDINNILTTLPPYFDTAEKSMPKFTDRLEQLRQTLNDVFASDYPKIKKLAQTNGDEEASKLALAMSVKTNDLRQKLKVLNDDFTKDLNTRSDNATAYTDATIYETIIAAGCALAAVMALAFALVQFGICRPIGGLIHALKLMAAGNFDVVLPGLGRKDEVGEIAEGVGLVKAMAVEKAHRESDLHAQRQQVEMDLQASAAAERTKAAEEQGQAMRRLGDGLRALANGDLTIRLNEGFTQNYAQIRDDFNEAVQTLKQTLVGIVSNSAAIGAGTDEISTAAEDLSRRTEQQAASLEETAASLDEITTTVNKTAEGAKHARDVVSAAKEDAEKSGIVVRNAIEAMSGIEKSSKQIGQIIGVIDEIAFQTNLLALNAGVEAARAGDAGRGFAVVASEVRALAQRSAEAAKEIKSLISTSTAQVDQGVQLVVETGKALQRIVTEVAEINGVVSAIAASAQEQATGLHQVNTAMNQMDQVTQQNAAMVEETTAAARSLAMETQELAKLIARFQTGEKAAPQASRRSTKPAPAARPTLKNASSGGASAAVRKPAPAAAQDTWEEF